MPPSRAGRAAAAGTTALLLLAPVPSPGALRTAPADPGAAAAAVAAAAPGDTVVLAPGVHRGPLIIRRSVTLRGSPRAVLQGSGTGTVVSVAASGATLEDLDIRGSGGDVLGIDAGVRIVGSAGVLLRRVRLSEVLYGIYGERADGLTIDRCDLAGRAGAGGKDEGNGIHLWSCRDTRVTDSSIRGFVDGIYLSFTHDARFARNRCEANSRYGFHTMYCQATRLERNRFAHNVAGCAIMFSNHLAVESNEFIHNRGPRTYGLLLRDCSDGDFRGNQIVDNTVAVFMDGSNRNRFEGNLLQDNGWGLYLFSSSEGNTFAGNTILNNDYPVALDMRRTNNRFDDGSRGNFWGENAPYDLDADGLSDIPYTPVSAFAFLSKQYPDLSIFARSPAVAALGVAERVIPALHPSEAVDRFPLVRPATRSVSGAGPDRAAPPRRAWAQVAGFLALGIAGAAGLAWGRWAA